MDVWLYRVEAHLTGVFLGSVLSVSKFLAGISCDSGTNFFFLGKTGKWAKKNLRLPGCGCFKLRCSILDVSFVPSGSQDVCPELPELCESRAAGGAAVLCPVSPSTGQQGG